MYYNVAVISEALGISQDVIEKIVYASGVLGSDLQLCVPPER